MKKVSILICIALFAATACNYPFTRKQYLNGFENLVNNVEKEYPEYKDKDWQKSDSLYKLYTGDFYYRYKDDLTKEDIHKVGELQGRYQVIKAKYLLKKGLDNVNDFVEEVDGFIEGVGEGIRAEEKSN